VLKKANILLAELLNATDEGSVMCYQITDESTNLLLKVVLSLDDGSGLPPGLYIKTADSFVTLAYYTQTIRTQTETGVLSLEAIDIIADLQLLADANVF
jgi:hypothetical protein